MSPIDRGLFVAGAALLALSFLGANRLPDRAKRFADIGVLVGVFLLGAAVRGVIQSRRESPGVKVEFSPAAKTAP
jgi:hypothetical protein